MRYRGVALFLLTLPGLARAAEEEAGGTAIIILVLLGLAAIIGGLSSIGDLRGKPLSPPRRRRKRPPHGNGESPRTHP
jgi:hypothetical protein